MKKTSIFVIFCIIFLPFISSFGTLIPIDNRTNLSYVPYIGAIDNVDLGIYNTSSFWFNGLFNWTTGDTWNIFDGSTLTFNESKLAIIYYNVSSVSVEIGTLDDGDSDSTKVFGDDLSLNVSETNADPGLDIRFNFSGVSDFNQLILRYKTDSESDHHTAIQLWNFIDSVWEDHDYYIEAHEWDNPYIPLWDSVAHIGTGADEGKVYVRIFLDDMGKLAHTHYFDFVQLSFGVGTYSSIEADPLSYHRDENINTGDFNATINSLNVTGDNWCNQTNCYTLNDFLTLGGVGNPFDQSLNTTDNVTFHNITLTGNLTASAGAIFSGAILGDFTTGYDNIRFGVWAHTPRIIFDNGTQLGQIDFIANSLRFIINDTISGHTRARLRINSTTVRVGENLDRVDFETWGEIRTRGGENIWVDGNLTVDTDTLFVDSVLDRVGIGTSSPAGIFEVKGTNPDLIVRESTATVLSNLFSIGNLSFHGSDESTNAAGIYTSIESFIVDTNSNVQGSEHEGGRIDFNIWRHDVATESRVKYTALTIDNNARVGIGTDSPANPIHIYKANTVSRQTVTDILSLDSSHASVGYDGFGTALVFRGRTYQSSTVRPLSRISSIQRGDSVDDLGNSILFETIALSSGTAAPVERMRITYDGKVGIGTSTPSYPLEIDGDVSDISLYVSKNVSATGFIDRTSIFDKSKNVWDYILDSDELSLEGEIDHSKFYGFVSYDINKTDYLKPVNEEQEFFNETSNKTETQIITTYPYTKKITEEGVSLGAEIALLRQAVYDLKQENEMMKGVLCKIGTWDFC